MAIPSFEALKIVYPGVYGKLQNSILDQLSKDNGNVSYDRRIQLGIILGQATHPSLEKDNVKAHQLAFNIQPAASSGKIATNKSKIKNYGGSIATQLQNALERK